MSDDQPQRPTTGDRDVWRDYWRAQGMPWRTEPEIDAEHQQFLAERRTITPDIVRGIYPFRNEDGGIRLSRGDVEWLLATHESGGTQGPVDWEDITQRRRGGLDLRGADLSKRDLSSLPLARFRGGIGPGPDDLIPSQYLDTAAVRLSGADLWDTHLEGSVLVHAFLDGAILIKAQLEQADLRGAHLEQSDLTRADLGAADLRGTFFDASTTLDRVRLGDTRSGFVRLANVHWGGVNITNIRWSEVDMLGGERAARQ